MANIIVERCITELERAGITVDRPDGGEGYGVYLRSGGRRYRSAFSRREFENTCLLVHTKVALAAPALASTKPPREAQPCGVDGYTIFRTDGRLQPYTAVHHAPGRDVVFYFADTLQGAQAKVLKDSVRGTMLRSPRHRG